MIQIVGRCSICGGQVTVPTVYHSVVPPVPSCSACGAVEASSERIIEMVPRREQVYPVKGSSSDVPESLNPPKQKRLLNG